ncbi:MAG: ECF transporter S component [Ruminococcus sp.]|nr:ECF transporter S component [Ruminococcus sp.]
MKSGKSNALIKTVLTALFASLCCVATMVIQIPTPTGGFLNLGDAVVVVSAFFLGPVYGAAAAGLGSALADIFAGYAQYAPATFIIKALMALCVWLVLHIFRKISDKKPNLFFLFTALGAVLAEVIMVLGYLVFEALILGYGAGAFASVLGNSVQGAAGIIAGTLLTELLRRTKIKEKFLK